MSINFAMTRGDTVSFNIAVTLSGAPFDLAGCSLWFTGKNKFTDPDNAAIFQKTISHGIVVTNSTQGLATVTLLPADTISLSLVKTILFWDLQLKDSGNNIYTINSGNLIVSPDITQAS